MPNWQPSSLSCLCSADFEERYFQQRLDLGLEISDNVTTKRLLYWTEVVQFLPLTRSNRLKMNIKFHNGSADRLGTLICGIILHNLEIERDLPGR